MQTIACNAWPTEQTTWYTNQTSLADDLALWAGGTSLCLRFAMHERTAYYDAFVRSTTARNITVTGDAFELTMREIGGEMNDPDVVRRARP